MPRISLLALMALAAAAAAVANGMSLAAPLDAQAGATRLGTAIGQDITARDAAAAKAQRAMGLREQATAAAEARVQAELQAQQQAAAATAAKPGASPGDDQYDELARIYQAMKPAAAAVVLEQLDMDVQMKVAQRMRERATALVLAQMSPKGAAALSMALARRKAPIAAPGAAPATGKSRSGK